MRRRNRRRWYSRSLKRKHYSLAVSVVEYGTNNWVVQTALGQVVPFPSQSDAWAWIDALTDEGKAATDRHARIRDAFSRR